MLQNTEMQVKRVVFMADDNNYLAGYPPFSGHRVYMPVIE